MRILHQITQHNAQQRGIAGDDNIFGIISVGEGELQRLLALFQHALQLTANRFDHILLQQHALVAPGGK